MSMTFTKLFSSITESTIWCEDSEIRVVWIAMLAMADKNGRVWAAIPGLANRARVPIHKCEEALNKFLSPDPYSRTPDHEGRRIEAIDGGWRLLNHGKYRAIRDDQERREYKKNWIAEKRKSEKPSTSVDNVDISRPQYTQAEAEAEADKDMNPTGSLSPPTAEDKPEQVPFEKIRELYNKLLPELPRCDRLTSKRKGQIRQRWNNGLPDLETWEEFFEFVRKSKFLMGMVPALPPRTKPFRADLEWLTNESNYAKIYERKYHG